MDAITLARRFHYLYEAGAAKYGYTTREDTRVFDPNSPNGMLMIAVCHDILVDFIYTDDLRKIVGDMKYDCAEGQIRIATTHWRRRIEKLLLEHGQRVAEA